MQRDDALALRSKLYREAVLLRRDDGRSDVVVGVLADIGRRAGGPERHRPAAVPKRALAAAIDGAEEAGIEVSQS